MSRRTYDFFVKHSQFLYPSCAVTSSLNPDAPSPGALHTLPPPQQPPTPTPPSDAPSPATPPLPWSTCRVPTPATSPPLQTPQPFVEPKLVSSPDYDAPPQSYFPLSLPTPGLAPASPPPPALDTSAPEPRQHASFVGAHNFVIKDSQFIDFSLAGSGLNILLNNSMPDAFHDSAARYPPPKCHLGTRKEYITQVIDWALSNTNNKSILWMCGPFGIGKSAVAQSCAEVLNSEDKLAAALFFSRSNRDRNDPQRVFTSIAFQTATKCRSFRNIVDARIREDLSLTTKSLSVQFNELLVRPLAQVDIARSGIERHVVIIDGLDECRGSPEQCEIVRVIAASARDRTTPFRWFITSRPEDPIIRTMKSPAVSRVSLHAELPVSRKIDHEILLYLTDEFNRIRETHGLTDSWPSGEVLYLLVEHAAGLWIYVSTIIRFIRDENSYGPEDQLRLVVQFVSDVSAGVWIDNPLAEMDFLYTLIMQRIPEKIRKTVQDLLLVRSITNWNSAHIVATLGVSEDQVRRSCASIQSVMELQGSDLKSMSFHFYHTLFLDFMRDPLRSKEFCIFGDFLIETLRERLDWLHQVCFCSTGISDIKFPPGSVLPEGLDRIRYYSSNLVYLWRLCGVPNHLVDPRTAASLEKLPFRMMLRLMGDLQYIVTSEEVQHINNNLPTEYRDKIIRKAKCPTPGCTNTGNVCIWGHGESEVVSMCFRSGNLILMNNQNPHPGWCFCGYLIKRMG